MKTKVPQYREWSLSRGRVGRGRAARWLVACLVGGLLAGDASPAWAQEGEPGKPVRRGVKDVGPDPLEQLEELKQELQRQMEEAAASAKGREESLRKEQAALLEAAREEANRRVEAERSERREETARLQQALDAAVSKQDKRESERAPAVGARFHGVSLYGYVQADYQLRQSSEDQLDPSSGQPLNQDRFLVRRARLGATFERGYGEGRIEVDGNTVSGPAFRLLDAEASLKWPGQGPAGVPLVMGTIGSFRIPFGFETPQDDRERFFLERSHASRAFFPGEYDLGARVSGGWSFVRYVIAVQNGEPLGSSAFPGLDPNHQKDILGRLGVAASIRERADLVAGVSALRGTGFHSGKLASKSTVQWVDGDENGSFTPGELVANPASAAGPSSSFTRFGFGADVLLVGRLGGWGETSLAAEFYLANDLDRGVLPADPKGIIGRSFREMGYYVSATQRIGRFVVGARFDYYNPDQDSNQSSKGNFVPTDVSYTTVSGAAAWVSSWGRLIVEYDRNWNHLGVDYNGLPSKLKDDAVIARGEVSF